MTFQKRMKIDGKQIASEIFDQLTKRVGELQKKNIVPHLVVILVGDDPASATYVKQKDLKAQLIGAKCTIEHLPADVSQDKLLSTIEQYNSDNTVHGLIVQRPLPKHISSEKINHATSPAKDIDAFHKDSPFVMPLAAAVLKILENVWEKSEARNPKSETNTNVKKNNDKNVLDLGTSNFDIVSSFDIRYSNFTDWLKDKNILIVGKGETGGGPTIALLRKMGIEPKVIDSKTENAALITQEADIIVTTVGRDNVIRPENIKSGVILIGVGMHKGEDGKLHGDYEEEDIKDIASFYTPIPGGVGPVNVAMLLSNLVYSAQQ